VSRWLNAAENRSRLDAALSILARLRTDLSL
jgi:hypothetical protein